MILRGRVHKFGDNVDTDVIIPARYLNTTDPDELARHCMEDIEPSFAAKVRPGDIVVGGDNFGCGSSREHAPLAIKASGVGCVVARSFARIFYRNAVNIGLPILECPEACLEAGNGDVLEVDLGRGKIVNGSKGREYAAQPFPEFILELIRSGGLVAHIRKNSGRTQREA